MFMSDALPIAETTSPPGPTDRSDSRSAGLLSLVRRLIDHGRSLIETLQQRNTPDAPANIAWRFGMISIALIIGRITQGLRLAETLETRVIRGARRLDAPPRQMAERQIQDRPRQSAEPHNPSDQDAALPSARTIARRVRHRPIGAVIADICRDLGIDSDHPLWAEVLTAITTNGGNRAVVVQDMARRGFEAAKAGIEPDLAPHVIALLDIPFGRTPPSAWATPPP